MREINDYISIYRQQTLLWRGPCSVSRVRPGDTDITAAGVEIAPELVITLTYSSALEDFIVDSDKTRFVLARRPEANGDIISIARSQDRRDVKIIVGDKS